MVVQRIQLIDVLRGVALLAMTVFHFAFDLELFGVKEPGFISQPHWKYFARGIATSFLFLTGISLFLAHANGTNWRSWRVRMLKIIAAATVITIATVFATPNQFIFFGILHAIAFASVAGLLFLKLPVILTVIVAIAVFGIGQTYETPILDHWIFWWTGLSEIRINSSDYVPVFPWFSAPLLGIAAAKWMQKNLILDRLATISFTSRLSKVLKLLGRHSLLYYLAHQPVMIALLLGYLKLSGNF